MFVMQAHHTARRKAAPAPKAVALQQAAADLPAK